MGANGVAFVGSKDIGLGVLETILRTVGAEQVVGVLAADDREDPRTRLGAFEALANDDGLEFATAAGVTGLVDAVERWNPAITIVSGWYRRIPVEELGQTKFFGFHASPLPRYRGGAPLVWQIIEGEDEIGASMFELVEGLDEGGIVAQRRRPFLIDETIADALDWARDVCMEMTAEQIEALVEGTAILAAQDHSQATYCSQRQPGDGRIDWTQPAERLHDFVRAQTRPYPGAFTITENGETLRVWTSALESRPYLGPPGAIVERDEGRALVTCGSGALWLIEVEAEGLGPAPAAEVLESLGRRLR